MEEKVALIKRLTHLHAKLNKASVKVSPEQNASFKSPVVQSSKPFTSKLDKALDRSAHNWLQVCTF